MNLIETLKQINAHSKLSPMTTLKVVCSGGEVFVGKYRGGVSASDNDPEIAQLDIELKSHEFYGLLESEIVSIEEIKE